MKISADLAWRHVAARSLLAALATGVAWLVLATPAEAIPAFARKYQFSCSTCHAPVPRLKPFGEEFAARGFRLEDPSQEPPRATYDTGDPTLRLLRELPLAVRVDGFGSWKSDAAAEVDIEWPWTFKILSGGPISERISYYVYFILEKGGVEGLEDAYLQFNTPFNIPFNLLVGQFQVSDPLFKRELRLERFDYDIFRTRVGFSPINLTYDRGIVSSWTFPGAIDTVFQVVNGSGIGHADEEDNFDNDGLKNVSLRLSRTFAEKLRLGVFTYWGSTDGAAANNRTSYVGPDAVITLSEKLQVNLQYLERRDDNPLFMGDGATEWRTRGGFAEIVYMPLGADGKYALTALYNKVSSDDTFARSENVSGTINYLLARNVRAVFEAGRDIQHSAGRISVGVMAAF